MFLLNNIAFLKGMIFLHESIMKYHGSLSTSNCLVDSRWVVKLADFGFHEFKRDADYDPEDIIKRYQGCFTILLKLYSFAFSKIPNFEK